MSPFLFLLIPLLYSHGCFPLYSSFNFPPSPSLPPSLSSPSPSPPFLPPLPELPSHAVAMGTLPAAKRAECTCMAGRIAWMMPSLISAAMTPVSREKRRSQYLLERLFFVSYHLPKKDHRHPKVRGGKFFDYRILPTFYVIYLHATYNADLEETERPTS